MIYCNKRPMKVCHVDMRDSGAHEFTKNVKTFLFKSKNNLVFVPIKLDHDK